VRDEAVGEMPPNGDRNELPKKGEQLSRPEKQAGRFAGQRVTPRSPKEALQPDTPPPPPIPPSRRHPALSAMSGFLSFILAIAIASVSVLMWTQHRLHEPGPLNADKIIYIAPGTDSSEIIGTLERDGVIDSPILLNATLWVEGNHSKVKAGEYQFKQNASLRDVIDILVSGKQVLHNITIPEGLTSEQIVERLKEIDVLIGDVIEIPKEGSLLPETYKELRGTLRANLIREMQDHQRHLVDQIWAHRTANLPLRSPYELVTLASIVEKETGKADERPRVASVFLNRLRKGMRLQSDPTIVYGLTGGKGSLGRGITESELEKPTPYNTYLVDGLPPGPIANPGRAALEAVANPSRTRDLYFVADGTGGHVFSETLDQHSRNVQRWRQIEKDMKDKQPAPDLGETAPQEAPQLAPPLTPPDGGRKSERSESMSVYGAFSAPNALPSLFSLDPAAAAIDRTLGATGAAARPNNGILAYFSAYTSGFEELRLSAPAVSAAAALDGSVEANDEQKAIPTGVGSTAAVVTATDSKDPMHARAFDSSRGTPSDPLKNKTYDLNYAKTVPQMQ
jgi:UPF0755 protein